MTFFRLSLLMLISLVGLSACSQRLSAPVRPVWQQPDKNSQTYTVLPRETLYAVAFRFELDFRQLAAWNQLKPPYGLLPGRVLRLGP